MNSTKMKAVVCTKYGSPEVLQIQEVDKPIPKANELLVKVAATTATAADSMMRRADPFISRFFLGFTKPKNPITGTGFSGTIEQVGAEVRTLKIGDRVFGETGLTFSANAEYVCVAEEGVLHQIPENMSFEEAAPLCDGALTSLNFLKEVANIKPFQRVLINGASGGLGTAAVQLAKHFGAEVTAVCGPHNIDLVKSLGADHVIDYTISDFTEKTNNYDIIYDTVGKASFSVCKKSLTKNGVYVSPVLDFGLLFQMLKTSVIGKKKALFSATGMLPLPKLRALLDELNGLLEKGFLKSVIDRCYPLSSAVEAHRYVDTGHKKGNVILWVN